MKTAQELLESSRAMNASSQPTQQSQPAKANDPRIANLWLRMGKQFGSRWTSQYGDCDDGTWYAALRHVDNETLGKALGRVALGGGEFPPSLPEFLMFCARAAGLPDRATAYAHACHSRWSHPVVYAAAKRVGLFELRHRSERDLKPLWNEHYGAVCAEWLGGARFEAPEAKAIERKPFVPASRETALKHLNQMKAMLGGAA